MPLHLLPKKSWNPYGAAARARVEADERADREHTQRLNEHEAAVRLAALRGVTPPGSPPPPPRAPSYGRLDDVRDGERRRQLRRREGEDDSARDIRVARDSLEDRAEGEAKAREARQEHDQGITHDEHGHLTLFQPPKPSRAKEARQQAEESSMGMRFSQAAGYAVDVKARPWYNRYSGTEELSTQVDPDDERSVARARREERRVATNDPMAAMKQAQTQLKVVERERDAWRREREAELSQMGEHREEEEMEPLSLDAPALGQDKRHKHVRRTRSRERHGRRKSSPDSRRSRSPRERGHDSDGRRRHDRHHDGQRHHHHRRHRHRSGS